VKHIYTRRIVLAVSVLLVLLVALFALMRGM